MKKTLALLLALAPSVWADGWFTTWVDETSDFAWSMYSDWNHKLPESGLFPSYFSLEGVSSMSERHGDSSLSWQKVGLSIPLADPRRSGGKDWNFNASFNAEVTFMDTCGAFDLRRNELYTLSLPLSVIVPEEDGDFLIFAVAPSAASDFVHRAHSFHVNMLLSYSVKYSETLTYSVGLGHSPDATVMGVMPVFSFDWKVTPEWNVKLNALRFSVMRDMGDGLSVGVFANGAGGSWAVNTEQGTRMLRVRSLVAGFTAEYDFSKPGETKRIVTMSVGSTLMTSADVCWYNSDLDRVEGHHYHPGLYVSSSVDFRF